MRKRLIRNLIVFNFHQKNMQVCTFIDQIFQAAEFLSYGATEQQLVERIIMNLHPEILKETAFLNKPYIRDELFRVVNQIEERFCVAEERRNMERETRRNYCHGESPDRPHFYSKDHPPRKIKCWHCGRTGHVRSSCFRRRERFAGRKILSSFQKVVGVPADAPLWTMVELKSGKVPALLDTGAQFSCVRSEVAEFL